MVHVLGQMSDGIWEESRRITGYWLCARVSDNGDLKIASTYRSPEWFYECKNPYRKMTDTSIRSYFADKIKQIARINLECNYKDSVRRDVFTKHGLEDSFIIPTDKADEYNKANAEVEQYLVDHPFSFRGQFNENNDTVLDYLSDYRGIKISVSDAYKAYKCLNAA